MIRCPSLYSFHLYYYPSVSTLSSLVVRLGFQARSVICFTPWDKPSQVTGEKRSSLLTSHRALIAGPACACHRKSLCILLLQHVQRHSLVPTHTVAFYFAWYWKWLQMFRFLSSLLWECGFLVQGVTHASCSLSNLTIFIRYQKSSMLPYHVRK